MSRRWLRSAVAGEAGFRLAVALAFVAALTSFIATAGPREQAANQDGAIQRGITQLAPYQRTIVASANWYAASGLGKGVLTQHTQNAFTKEFTDSLGPPIVVPADRIRAIVWGPLVPAPDAAKSAFIEVPPDVQLTADSGLSADGILLAGSWPGSASVGLPGKSAADRTALVIPVVVTQENASRFSLKPGSFVGLGRIGSRLVALRVTGIIKPRPGAAIWSTAAVQAVPFLVAPSSPAGHWVGGAITGEGGLVALQSVWPGAQAFGNWIYPVRLHGLTVGDLSRMAAAVTAVTASTAANFAALSTRFDFYPPTTASSQLPAALLSIQQQAVSISGIDELLIAGLFAACLLLMLLCAGLAAERYAAELALIRARGGSTRQVAYRTLRRALLVSGPGIAVGFGLALRLGASTPSAIGWLLPAVNAIMGVTSVPILCAWHARKNGSWQAAQRPEAAGPRRPVRRIIAEITVLAVAAAAIAALRVRGVASGHDQLGLVAPILVAIVASIVIARLYPIPIRVMLPLAGRSRGPVSFLGLNRAGRSGVDAILPALALVLTLTLAAFGVMLIQSVEAGQRASSWAQTGADAIFTAPGNDVINVAGQRAVGAVPGVRHTALVYVEVNNPQSPYVLITTAGAPEDVSTAIVNPVQYAALAKDTPWPQFPAAALAKRPGPIPILVSAGATVTGLGPGVRQTLTAYGIKIRVRVAGVIRDTPAFPVGGAYIVFPQWAQALIPSVPGPDELLATGPAIATARLTATATLHLHDDGLVLRSTLLQAQQNSPAEYGVRLFEVGSWAAAALSAVALFFGLGTGAQARRHLRTRMSALGMSAAQARALALFDPLSLLVVAIAGMVAAGGLLSLISVQVVPLRSLTSSAAAVPVQLDLAALLYPAAGATALALIAIAVEHTLASRAESGRALRYEEAV